MICIKESTRRPFIYLSFYDMKTYRDHTLMLELREYLMPFIHADILLITILAIGSVHILLVLYFALFK